MPYMDLRQVIMNGGPPCYWIEGRHYCGRAERWAGHHGENPHHAFEVVPKPNTVVLWVDMADPEKAKL